MPPALTIRDLTWGAGWAAGIALGQVVLWNLPAARLAQFLIQFFLAALALCLPGLLAWNLLPRHGSRVPMRWQLVVLLWTASILAVQPWNSPSVGCPEC